MIWSMPSGWWEWCTQRSLKLGHPPGTDDPVSNSSYLWFPGPCMTSRVFFYNGTHMDSEIKLTIPRIAEIEAAMADKLRITATQELAAAAVMANLQISPTRELAAAMANLQIAPRQELAAML